MIHKEYPIRFIPKGLSDSWDSTEAFPGACKSMQNLVFDQANPDLLCSRPGVGNAITTFSGFTGATGITLLQSIGNILYGMVSTTRLGAFDEPFSYNVLTNTFNTISGTTNTNLPSTQSTSGDWTAPTMAVIGAKIIITHPGFSGTGSNFFGEIDISNPAAPVWSAHNTATHALPSVPTSVANFNNRAYFACGNVLYYSDVLVPDVMTNAGQSLTVGDTTSITGLSGLPITTSTAGVVSGLTIFKAFNIWQVTGDAAITNSLTLTFLSLNVGCSAPSTIQQTPVGTLFISLDGPYVVTGLGQVAPLTKNAERLVQDIQRPFQNIMNPTRAASAFTGSIYRVCIQTTTNGISGTFDYWFDITSRRWSGPHTWAYDQITQYSDYFIVSYTGVGASLFNSPYIPKIGNTYLDNGTPITVNFQTSFLPKNQNINVKQVVESTIELSAISTPIIYQISAFDEQYNLLNSSYVTTTGTALLWGTTGEGGSNQVWGTTAEGGSNQLWSTGQGNPTTYLMPWTVPLLFKKVSVLVTSTANYGLNIGTMSLKYSDTGITNLR